MSEIKLTRRQLDLLKHLRFRQAGDPADPCWLYLLPRNRWQLVVLTVFSSYERHDKFVMNGRTLASLEAAGLIEYGPDGQPLPAPYAARRGSTVTLTPHGYAAVQLDPRTPRTPYDKDSA